MKIRCRSCSHSETLNKELIVTLLGGAVAGFGFWAWVSFLFAGTGFAMPICIALVVGGPALVINTVMKLSNGLLNMAIHVKNVVLTIGWL